MSRCQIDGKIPGKILVKMNEKKYLYNPEKHLLQLSSESIPKLSMYEAPVQIYLLPLGSESGKKKDTL